MSWKAGEVMSRLTGGVMLMISSGFFIGMTEMKAFFVPGLLFGIGGFLLAARRSRQTALPPDAQQRLARLEQAYAAQQQDLATTQLELAGAQEELARLKEVDDFMRQLGSGERSSAAVPGQAQSGVV